MIDCDGTDKLTIALIICWSGKDTLIEDEIKQAGQSCIVPYMVIMICNTFSRFVLH